MAEKTSERSGPTRRRQRGLDFGGTIFPLELDRLAERQKQVEGGIRSTLRARRRARRSTVVESRPRNMVARLFTSGLEVAGKPTWSSWAASAWSWARDALSGRVVKSHFRGVHPAADLSLVGLALSGGGIRSATFNLGVVQALAERGVFRLVDYLSTVSGGGYLGACLSSLLADATAGATFPLGFSRRGTDYPALRHLRNSGHYLATGLVDFVRIPALLLRGALLHLLVLLPYVVAAVWLTWWIDGASLRAAVASGEPRSFFGPVGWASLVFLAWVFLSPLVQRLWPPLVRFLARSSKPGDWIQAQFEPGGFATRNHYERSFGILALVVGLMLLLRLLPTLLSYYHYHVFVIGDPERSAAIIKGQWWYAVGAAVAGSLVSTLGSTAKSKLYRIGALAVLTVLGPALLVWLYLVLGVWAILGHSPLTFAPGSIWFDPLARFFQVPLPAEMKASGWWLFTLLVALVGLYTWRFVDMNSTSMHSFYRDRLSKAYLMRQDAAASPVLHYDRLPLSRLARSGRAPYHLINCALNLQAEHDPNLRERQADFFLFSRLASGSPRTGYCWTTQLEAAHRRLDLGTAMAISGAAAAPNMGSSTIKPLVFLMALFNVRLGYWLPNPGQVAEGRVSRSGVGPFFLIRELFSLINERSSFVNVSDGGHIENLALYELLRRRCEYIIAGDAEADPELTFGGLAKLIRYAKIDMGIDIEIDLDDIRKAADGTSRRSCALGTIYYPEGGVGYLLYIKASVTGTESEPIREYRSRHQAFPHETTGDQFFDEAQFEAYRSLGHRAVESLFNPTPAVETMDDLREWFRRLETKLRAALPDAEVFAHLQEELTELDGDLGESALAPYAYQIYPEIAPPAGSDAEVSDEQRRHIFHFCNKQLQLMENAVLSLRLDRAENQRHHANRGWMNLFRRWAEADYFRWAWAVSIGTYSVGFQHFCEAILGLESRPTFQEVGWDDLDPVEQQEIRAWGLAGADGLSDARDRALQVRLSAARRKGDGAFPVGVAVVRFDEQPDRATLLYCRVRRHYRRMRVFDRMLPELRREILERLPGARLSARFPSSESEELKRLYYILKRHGFPVRQAPGGASSS